MTVKYVVRDINGCDKLYGEQEFVETFGMFFENDNGYLFSIPALTKVGVIQLLIQE